MHIHSRILIASSVTIVWRCLTEFALQKQWISQLIDETIDDPSRIGLGTESTMRIREGNRAVAYRSIVTAWEPEKLLSIQLSGGSFAKGMAMQLTYVLTANAQVTVMDYDVKLPLRGLFFKLLAPVIWLMSIRNARADLVKLQLLAPKVELEAEVKKL